jgi:hypothetical protein
MAEVLVSFDHPVRDNGGVYHARAVGRLANDGMWEGWLEFVPADGGDVLVTGVESRQPERIHLDYWATGLTHVYLEGALNRARRPNAMRVTVPDTPASSEPARVEHVITSTMPRSPEPVLDPFEVGSRSLDILKQELRALNRARLANIITAYELNPGTEDVSWMSDAQLAHFIVTAVETRLPQRVR